MKKLLICLFLIVAAVINGGLRVSALDVEKPSNLQARAYSDHIKIAWDGVKSASAYKIYTRREDVQNWKSYKPITETYCTIPLLEVGTRYKVKIEALTGTEGAYFALSSKVWTLTTLSSPAASESVSESDMSVYALGKTEVTGVSKQEDGIQVSWSAVDGAGAYKIQAVYGDYLIDAGKVQITGSDKRHSNTLILYPDCYYTFPDNGDMFILKITPIANMQGVQEQGFDGIPTYWLIDADGLYLKFPLVLPDSEISKQSNWVEGWRCSSITEEDRAYNTFSKVIDCDLKSAGVFLKKTESLGYTFKQYSMSDEVAEYVFYYKNKQIGMFKYDKTTEVLYIAFLQRV